ncbi:MAG: hypothetical protein AAF282_10325 [Cyanobacteria bacterium P01_A01_bin.15]
MRFGAVCIVCLFLGIELFNWVSGLHWLAEFSRPLAILGGLGLAIASHPTSIPSSRQSSETLPEPSPSPSEPSPPPAADPPPEPTISFTIHKNVRP